MIWTTDEKKLTQSRKGAKKRRIAAGFPLFGCRSTALW
jgi:hypothetical protein